MSYRDPLDAARARISALEDLLDTRRFEGGESAGSQGRALSEARAALAEERAEHAAENAALHAEIGRAERQIEELQRELIDERARREADVSLLRTKLEEADRAVANNASLFEAEQTMQRAEVAAESARLAQRIVSKDTQLRELREEIRVLLGGDLAAIRAHYSARVRAVGTELAEQGDRARRLEVGLREARDAVQALPSPDVRDREGLVERELVKRKVAIAERELERVRDRVSRLEDDLKRITAAEAELASRRA
ncbi:MAG: hypothetical protein H6719_37685 [Sandaracinaceae bacterium]|nr:hypothetical protein [Sandaracinaceae bacterium]